MQERDNVVKYTILFFFSDRDQPLKKSLPATYKVIKKETETKWYLKLLIIN